jgi:hypothetical protein
MLLPNKLCIKNGVLLMKDGSKVQDYLRLSTTDNSDVVIFTREKAEKLLMDATAYRLSKITDDERFCLAA